VFIRIKQSLQVNGLINVLSQNQCYHVLTSTQFLVLSRGAFLELWKELGKKGLIKDGLTSD